MSIPTETEVKIRLSDCAAMFEILERAGFTISAPRQFESNTVYDTAEGDLRRREMLLRLRQSADKAVLTWKGRGNPGPHKSRPEIETSVGSLSAMHQILVQLGYQPTFRYEKYRTEFSTGNAAGVVTLDETPIGDFLELEGPGEWIDQTTRQLGFSEKDYILASYGRLYLTDCAHRGVEPSHMVFSSHT